MKRMQFLHTGLVIGGLAFISISACSRDSKNYRMLLIPGVPYAYVPADITYTSSKIRALSDQSKMPSGVEKDIYLDQHYDMAKHPGNLYGASKGYQPEALSKIVGLDVDIADEVGRILQVKIDNLGYAELRFDKLLLNRLEKGEFDLIMGVRTSAIEELNQEVSFSSVYREAGLSVVVSIDSEIKSLEDLHGKKGAITNDSKGFESASLLKGIEGVSMVEYKQVGSSVSPEFILNLIKDSEVDFTILSDPYICFIRDDPNFRLIPVPKDRLNYLREYIVVFRKNSAIKKKFDSSLVEMKNAGKLEDLTSKWSC